MTDARNKQKAPLPHNLPPRGLSRGAAAAYVGISPGLFDRAVKDGFMPKPLRIYGRLVWDLMRLDQAFMALAEDDSTDGGDDAGYDAPARL